MTAAARLAARLDSRWAARGRRGGDGAPPATAAGVRLVPVTRAVVRARVAGAAGGSAPPIVLVPDPPNVIEHYDGLVARLAAGGPVVALDLPGFGLSLPRPGFDYSLAASARALADALDALGVRGATLSAGCLGGFVAMLVAKARPDLVARLALVQVPSCAEAMRWVRGGYWWLFGTPFLGQAVTALARRRVARAWYGGCLGAGARADDYRAPADRVLRAGGAFCLASAFQQFRPDREDLAGIQQETTVVWGAADRTHPTTDRRSITAHLPRARLEEWAHCGHYPDLEDAAAWARVLRA